MTGHTGRTAAQDRRRATKSGEMTHDTAPPVIHTSGAMGIVARKMSEKDLQECVVAMARACGWLCYHTYDSRRSEPGYPDLTLVHADTGRVIWAELKTAKGRLRPAQVEWLGALREVARDRGLEVYCFRPMDWIDGTIEAILRGEKVANGRGL